MYGTDEVYITQISNGIVEGTFPANDEEVMLTPNSVTALGVQLDSVTLHTLLEIGHLQSLALAQMMAIITIRLI